MTREMLTTLIEVWWVAGWIPCAFWARAILRYKNRGAFALTMALGYGFFFGPLPLLYASLIPPRPPHPVLWQSCPYCRSVVAIDAVRCPFCTSPVGTWATPDLLNVTPR